MTRDFIGYGPTPPDPRWPGGARIAVNFVLNHEEGSEPSYPDGDNVSEWGLTEVAPVNPGVTGRDLAAESMFAYGSRVGVWRILRLFAERSLPLTVFGCALALERNPQVAAAIRAAGPRRVLSRLALGEALRTNRGRRARTDRQGRRLDRRDHRRTSAGLVLSLRAWPQHAAPADRGRRVPL
jgi:peptidoglycan/xylan/chitin deacetylase (PgdA/CDA1 family)